MRKPRPFKLTANYSLTADSKGRDIFYLKTDAVTFHWIDGRGKVKRLIKWLQKIERYQK